MVKNRPPYPPKPGLLLVVAVLGLLLSSCSPGGLFSGNMMYAPQRTVERSGDTLQSALLALSQGDQSGQIRLSESELESLLNMALVDNSDDERLIRDIQAWLEPDGVYLKVYLRDGAISTIPGEVALNLKVTVQSENGRLVLSVPRASLGALTLFGPGGPDSDGSSSPVRSRVLLDRASPLNVTVESGEIVIDVP